MGDRLLLVLRHGKSDWGASVGSDHDRPLAPRGRKAARRMGRLLSGAGLAPDLVVTSTAERAAKTAEIAAEAGGWSCEVSQEPAFYGSTPAEVMARVRRLPDDARTVLLVGHEPTWSSLVARLVGGGAIAMPTAAVAVVGLPDRAWRELEDGTGELVLLMTPRTVKALHG